MNSQKFERDKNIDPVLNERHVQSQPLAKVLGNPALADLKSKEEP
ncbi:hypothetical protein PHIN9_03030 [Polynucleobacter sp. HIN9]|nr:hypothetical protein [Polynucleobacter sp. HIN9]BEI40372.1 hypothetical protein PHIN9_03030 [Polynucleobacter sp. HIN9]